MAAPRRKVDEGAPARFLDHVRRRSGLIIERADDRYAFTHLSFQEYFAAVYLRDQIVTPEWLTLENLVPGISPDELRGNADDDAWRETFVFLFELFATEAPAWCKQLRKCPFGEGWQDVPTDGKTRKSLVCLLARLAVNSHAEPDDSLREQAMRRCWEWEIARQQTADASIQNLFEPPSVSRILLGGDPEERRLSGMQLAEVAMEAKAQLLNLAETGVTDLGPLANLKTLQYLELGGTGVTNSQVAELKASLPDLIVFGRADREDSSINSLRAFCQIMEARLNEVTVEGQAAITSQDEGETAK